MSERLRSAVGRAIGPLTDGGIRSLALPAVLLAVQYGVTLGAMHRHRMHDKVDAIGWILLALGPLALTVRRRHPVFVLWVAFAATLAPHGSRAAYVTLIVAFVLAASRGHRQAAWVVLVVGYVTSLWLAPLVFNQATATLDAALLLASWLALLAVAAEVVRVRDERAVAARAARRLDARNRRSEGRLQMARDLHDVIGHNMSLINIQAGVGLDLIDRQPEQARTALNAIRSASKEALEELRAMLDAIRQDDDVAPRAPAPSLRRLPDLIAATQAAGVRVTAEVEGDSTPLNATIELAAYRIVQESLTNVVRHAPGSNVLVRLTYGAGNLDIRIADDGKPRPDCDPHRDGQELNGTGILGMRERAASLGGELTAGPSTAKGFVVSARLPTGSRS
jgi:signal transduction histidine kinase